MVLVPFLATLKNFQTVPLGSCLVQVRWSGDVQVLMPKPDGEVMVPSQLAR